MPGQFSQTKPSIYGTYPAMFLSLKKYVGGCSQLITVCANMGCSSFGQNKYEVLSSWSQKILYYSLVKNPYS
jgi:hypothetical protein